MNVLNGSYFALRNNTVNNSIMKLVAWICKDLKRRKIMTASIYTELYYTFIFIFNYLLQLFKAYCAIWVRCSNFRHQASPCVFPRESTQRRKLEVWARNVREFCLNAQSGHRSFEQND